MSEQINITVGRSWQRDISDRRSTENDWFEHPKYQDFGTAAVKPITYNSARPIIEEHEWLGNMPLPKSCRYIYGLFFGYNLGGCVVYVEPSTRQFNALYPRQVVQLNRGACVFWTPRNSASFLIGGTFKFLRKAGVKLIVAYCTPEAGEVGTIYQALNFKFIGMTEPSKMYLLDGRWVSERTLADKKKWAKSKDVRWQEAFESLPSRDSLPKFKYVLPIGTKRENTRILSDFGWETNWHYPKRNDSNH